MVAVVLTVLMAAIVLYGFYGTRGGIGWALAFFTPIEFHGKVVNENGQPIPGADVMISFVSNPGAGEKHPKEKKRTDAAGLFDARGLGLGIVVMVSKEGYDCLPQSEGNFTYAKGAGPVNTHTDSKNPAVFVLRTMAPAEPLVVRKFYAEIRKDGIPLKFNLQAGRFRDEGDPDIQIECWTQDQNIPLHSNEHFAWRCRVSVLGGGLIRRAAPFAFEAPVDGYVDADIIEMPAASADWKDEVSREYFFKLHSGLYARASFTISAGRYQFVKLDSYLNPENGSRNLEYDSRKKLAAP